MDYCTSGAGVWSKDMLPPWQQYVLLEILYTLKHFFLSAAIAQGVCELHELF